MCWKPKKAWRLKERFYTRKNKEGKTIVGRDAPTFKKPSLQAIDKYEEIEINCGHCEDCLIQKSNDWATRCWAEAQLYKNNCFITLTYDNEHLPENRTLDKKDLRRFWDLLRKKEQGYEGREWKGKTEYPIRYFSCGEYGPKTGRPHYHAGVFNWIPKDLKPYKQNQCGDMLYTSKSLKNIWGRGFVIIGLMTYESACYIARYTTKKLRNRNWDAIEEEITKNSSEITSKEEKIKMRKNILKSMYCERLPEFTEASRKGGIGIDYWEKNKESILKNKGIYIKIKGKVKLKRIPSLFIQKLRNEDNEGRYKADEYSINNEIEQKNRINEILKNTDLTLEEYKKMLKEKQKQKYLLLKRTNCETIDNVN